MNPYSKLFTTKEFDGGREVISVINESLPKKAYEKVLDIVGIIRENGAGTDYSYEIVDRAAMALESQENIKDIDAGELSNGTASVYTGQRLDYLTNWNQSDVTEIVKTHDVDIATAAAIWYEDQVAQAIGLLVEAHGELVQARTVQVDTNNK